MTEKKDIDLSGYKEKVKTAAKGFLFWDKELIFRGMTQSGYEIEFDAAVQWGCMPTESLMLSLAGCLGIDTVSFLQKMRAEIHKFKMDIDGERNETPPQYYKAISLFMHIEGKNITEKMVERAVKLSQEKYCSVYHSLRPDMKVTVGWEITETEAPHEVK